MNVRTVITGIGMVTPLGTSETTWSSLLEGTSGVGPINRFDASAFPCRIAGEVKNFDAGLFLPPKEALKTDPFIQYALAAALMAKDDAGFKAAAQPPFRTGVLIGSGRGGVTTTEKNMAALLTRGPRAVSPFYAPMSLVNMASGYVAMKLGAQGPCLDVSTACATGTHAVGEAMKIIQRGDADVMLAGGTEAALTPLVLAGFCQAKALSLRNNEPRRASRPFDRDRDGFVLAEGACVLVLEELGHAERRGARIYAELAGYGLTSDAFHYTRPDPSAEGPSRAMSLALRDAGMAPEEIEYVNAHGTSTRSNDRIETVAIKRTFGSHAGSLAVSASKSMLGHMLGAAGAVEAAVTALALRDGIIPPTLNLDNPSPECDLDYVPHEARRQNVRSALSNSLGFGGINAALVLKKYP
ncbi:MAG: beta-ketoacyl-[acyl-carrier-protein] synthase II [Nitrospirae bacterium GWD2_57_9]|nr:MAG: beta-ketoacyl-[acyl-carrier-protein] synthase II [Nitrospirae bacterium GWD2_57_9]OGW46371.1 MAG: beta-ketoacyl-[acyl-carrier-protein] synthase II [Nitrospirae bacterium GWC2_57_9]